MSYHARIVRFFVRLFFVLLVLAGIFLFLYSTHITHILGGDKTITILAWPQEIDATVFADFEEKTGIKVHVRYVENNEELAVRLLATGGHDIDVIMPTDYAAEMFIKKGLLKKIDTRKLSFMQHLNPQLMGRYFDPSNEYTIPYYWGIYGIGFDKNYFSDAAPPASWGVLFDPGFKTAHISMPDNPRYLVSIAAQYIYGTIDVLAGSYQLADNLRSVDSLPTSFLRKQESNFFKFDNGLVSDVSSGKQNIDKITQLLITQKPIVELYTESRGEYLLASRASALTVLLSADVAKAMKIYPHIDFFIPKEGSFMLIDSFALSVHTHKDELIYQFLNYLYQPEILKIYVDKFIFFPATTNVTPAFQPDVLKMPLESGSPPIDFYRSVFPVKVLSDIWIALKA